MHLTAVAESSMPLLLHPGWSTGPHRLQIPSLQQQGDVISQKTDYLNPTSWVGDVSVANVTLQTSWSLERDQSEQTLRKISPGFSFLPLIEAENIDILHPFSILIEEGADIPLEEQEEEIEQVHSLLALLLRILLLIGN